ncbi:DEAD/DEAH box helicase [Thermofilum sp.]|uniref:DEAD/DEAH box helicase n=1 Tax=Thermofilum sp. TaxID=1961369 RepID=UPI00316A671E
MFHDSHWFPDEIVLYDYQTVLMGLMPDEKLIQAYHQIITRLEIPRVVASGEQVKEGKWYVISNISYSITKDEILELLRGEFSGEASQIFEELVKRGFLIPLSGSSALDGVEEYRSLHMDVLIRSSEIRTAYDSSRYLLSSKLAYQFVPTPTELDRRISLGMPALEGGPLSAAQRDLEEAVNLFFEGHRDLVDSYKRIVGQFVQGLDAYQALSLADLLRSNKSVHVLVAPTGSGKTEIFLLYALAWLMRQRYLQRDQGRVLLLYPRKALTADQASRIIKLLHISSENKHRFTFAIRDGDTPRRNDLWGKEDLRFRGVECPKCGGELVVRGPNDGIVCKKCREKYDFVMVTREQAATADVIATNPWALEVRLLDSNKDDVNVETIGEVGLVIIDEAHEYKGIGGGLFRALLDVIRYVKRVSRTGENLRIILSSATIPQPSDFASKLTGASEKELQVIGYDDVRARYGEGAISGRRLVLLGLFSMSPQFSWNTYCQLWLVLTTFLSSCYELRRGIFSRTPSIQSVLFVNNIRELKRVRSGFLNNLTLGEPKDHLNPQIPAIDPFCYWHYIPSRYREEVRKKVEQQQMRGVLENKLAIMLSELDISERTQNISRLRRGESLAVLSTSSLELGVDYRSVMFILNSGLDNPISLVQRIGRGGRGAETLRTVLGIVLARASIIDTYLLYDRAYSESLLSLRPSASYKLLVTRNNPQVEERARLIKAVASLALEGKRTYASQKPLRSESEVVNFLRSICEKIEEDTHEH